MQQLVCQPLRPLEAEGGPANRHKGDHQPGHEFAQKQCGRYQDHFVEHRALGRRVDHREFTPGINTGDLLHVKREVVAEHTGRLLGGDFCHHRDVVEQSGYVVEKREQARSQVESRWAKREIVPTAVRLDQPKRASYQCSLNLNMNAYLKDNN